MRHGADISVTRTYDNYIAALNLPRGIPAIILTIFRDNFDRDKGRYEAHSIVKAPQTFQIISQISAFEKSFDENMVVAMMVMMKMMLMVMMIMTMMMMMVMVTMDWEDPDIDKG